MIMNILIRLVCWLFYSFFVVMDVLLILLVWFIITVTIKIPVPKDLSIVSSNRTEIAPDFYTLKNNWIKKSETGLWEIYVEGDGFERGVIEGKLNKELAEKQEIAFLSQIQEMIPSKKVLNYLKMSKLKPRQMTLNRQKSIPDMRFTKKTSTVFS